MRRRSAALSLCGLVLLAAAPAFGGRSAGEEDGLGPTVYSRLSGEVGVDAPSKYFDRGILNEGEGLVVQPWASFALTVLEGRGALGDFDLTLDYWNSFHTGPTGAGFADARPPRAWYETDLYVGARALLWDRLEVGTSFAWAWSPNGNFERIDEVWTTLSWDDAPAEDRCVLGARWLGWQPSAVFTAEVRGQNDGGLHRGAYLGLSVSPTLGLRPALGAPLTLSFPATLGLGFGGFYEDEEGDSDAFGFASIAARLEAAWGMGGEEDGDWALVLGLEVLFLGEATAEYNEGRDVQLVATAGLRVSF